MRVVESYSRRKPFFESQFLLGNDVVESKTHWYQESGQTDEDAEEILDHNGAAIVIVDRIEDQRQELRMQPSDHHMMWYITQAQNTGRSVEAAAARYFAESLGVLDGISAIKYKSRFIPKKNFAFVFDGRGLQEVLLSTAFWHIYDPELWMETQVFGPRMSKDLPQQLLAYDKLHMAPEYVAKGVIGLDYHWEARDEIRDLLLARTLAKI